MVRVEARSFTASRLNFSELQGEGGGRAAFSFHTHECSREKLSEPKAESRVGSLVSVYLFFLVKVCDFSRSAVAVLQCGKRCWDK